MRHNKLSHSIIALMLCCSLGALADNYVILNQVLYDSPLNEIPSISPAYNGEFIELYNAGVNDVALNGWQLKGGSPTEVWTFHITDSIKAGGYLLVACQRGSNNHFQLSDWFEGALGKPIVMQNKIVLANSGETITLCNSANDTIDQMTYDGTSHLSNPYRLHAENPDSIPDAQCYSLHRTWVEFDQYGKVIPGTSQWRTDLVTFSKNKLPHDTYHEDYLFGESTMPTGENYVLSIVPLDPTTRININNGSVSLSSGVRIQSTLTYLDGLGREEQTIALHASPHGQDMVSAIEYKGKKNVHKQWLPVAIESDGQRMPLADLKEQAIADYNDSRPYTEMQYEPSAQGRITKRYMPGEEYYEPHGATKSYEIYDGTETVRLYTIVRDSVLKTTGANYPANSLYKTITADEDGNTICVYTNQQGQTILEKRANNYTYYVYDNLKRLRYILPHTAQSKLANGEYNPSNATLRVSAYYYQYDGRGNMIYKRLPGCEPQLMVYDKAGQLILKQSGNQRAEDKWTLCAYDSLGRNLYIAEVLCTTPHCQLISQLANVQQVEHWGNGQANAIQNTGYATSLFGVYNPKPLIVNYYDNYSFLNSLSSENKNALYFQSESTYERQHENATGLLTGTRVYDLSENRFTIVANYYNAQGRVIQKRSIRDDASYSTSTNTEYLFDGSVAQQLTVQGSGNNLTQEHYRYTYDHAGRLLSTQYQLNNNPEITLSAFSYDSIGRLVQNLLPNIKDTIWYSYDMRNRLTENRSKHFSERLFYADHPSAEVHACYNGNVSAIHTAWKDTANTFSYFYDAQNRLLSSKHLTDYNSQLSEAFTYTADGNLLTLKRFSGTQLVDNLEYDYYNNDGNQLLSVTDSGVDADLYGTSEFLNGDTQADTTMFYDANGNLIRDLNRDIIAIKYNILNLPDTILFSKGNKIVNLYDAAGHKYKSFAYTVTPTTECVVTEHTGNTELCYTQTDTLSYRIFNSIGYYADSAYFYYVKDHLGNICAVVNASGDSVIQRTMYYASGVPMAVSTGRDKQPYLYNGKELVTAHGWNTYDYGFRGYYAAIGRFTSIDPLAEQTPWLSPYSYAGNRFVNAIDWMGLGGMAGFSNAGDISQYIVYDGYSGRILDWDLNDVDRGVYVYWGDDWEIGGDRSDLLVIGTHKKGLSLLDIMGSGGIIDFKACMESFTCLPQDVPCLGQQPTTFQRSIDASQNIVNYSASTLGFGATLKCNELWWIGKNKQLYFQYQRFGAQRYVYNNSYQIAKQTIRPVKTLAKELSGAGIFLDVAEIVVDEEVKPSNIINSAIASFAFVPGCEWVPIVYGLVDIGSLVFTGESLGDKANNYWGTIK